MHLILSTITEIVLVIGFLHLCLIFLLPQVLIRQETNEFELETAAARFLSVVIWVVPDLFLVNIQAKMHF